MKQRTVILLCLVAASLPVQAQGLGVEIKGLNTTLDQLFTEMLPQCSGLINVGRAIGGFAALFYISSRIFRHLVNVEPIDFYPLFRPFAIGMAITLFPTVIAMINGVMSLTVTGTAALVNNSDVAITQLLKQKDDAVKNSDAYQAYIGASGDGNKDEWLKYTNQTASSTPVVGSLGDDVKFAMAKASYNFRNSIKQWLSEVLTLLYEAASLCINALRTFFLLILAIVGPLAFGLSIFDGLQQTLMGWVSKYLNIYLWLPVTNILASILGKIQQGMLKLDISQVQQAGDTFFSQQDSAYLIFLLIGIVSFFCVPSFTNQIIHASGASALTQRMTSVSSSVTGGAAGMAGSAAGMGAGMAAGAGSSAMAGLQSLASKKEGGEKEGAGSPSFQQNRLSGASSSGNSPS